MPVFILLREIMAGRRRNGTCRHYHYAAIERLRAESEAYWLRHIINCQRFVSRVQPQNGRATVPRLYCTRHSTPASISARRSAIDASIGSAPAAMEQIAKLTVGAKGPPLNKGRGDGPYFDLRRSCWSNSRLTLVCRFRSFARDLGCRRKRNRDWRHSRS